MRRRDEPKLDELKKLLRRLENIEVEKGLAAVAKPASEASPPGYVGALRGAALPAIIEDATPAQLAPPKSTPVLAGDMAPRPEGGARTFGMAAIIIGATTAAVVSTLVAVALAPWLGGQGKSALHDANALRALPERAAVAASPGAGDSRGVDSAAPAGAAPASAAAPALAPSPTPSPESSAHGPARSAGAESATPASAAPPTEEGWAPAPAATASVETARLRGPAEATAATRPENAENLLKRADALIAAGDLAGARLVLERAAGIGSGIAALMLGATYDPVRIAEFRKAGAKADIGLARAWYERARALGTVEATSRLTELAKR
jgi:hypothetical protein